MVLSTVRAKELIDTGCAPLDVMIKNMMFWHNSAEAVGFRIQEVLDDAKTKSPEEKLDVVKDLKPMLSHFVEFRKNSQACAEGAAPYVHSRFTAIQGEIRHSSGNLRTINPDNSQIEASESYSRLRQASAEQVMEELGLTSAGPKG